MNTSDLSIEEQETMPAKRNIHPLQIAGLALLSSSLVFSVLLFGLQMDSFFGVIVGCAVTGLALSTAGIVLAKRANPRRDTC